ncbi:unnamed protein product [Fusarium graminearum]|uniref:Uncharacterized protein n=1 Tax=Gibberella zeae TaxID=5518 RepID=A0A8H3JNG4_GIBZA|nr:hypothetical protein HG531_000966 [Fusarium graminearum]CAF3471575.1 unnamed protein product [Fusarium graminearum]CAF3659885.1 unnamed protein product [Fusarium graminearum]CAG1970823.1 unnamed protein product [Fusarium graminearum]CAG2005494.1 unnamed protein product [Fusarium graminearum]
MPACAPVDSPPLESGSTLDVEVSADVDDKFVVDDVKNTDSLSDVDEISNGSDPASWNIGAPKLLRTVLPELHEATSVIPVE